MRKTAFRVERTLFQKENFVTPTTFRNAIADIESRYPEGYWIEIQTAGGWLPAAPWSHFRDKHRGTIVLQRPNENPTYVEIDAILAIRQAEI